MKLLVLSLVLLGTLLDAAADLPDGVRREVSLCTGGTIVEITTSDPELVAVLRDQVKKLIGPDAAFTKLEDGIRAEVTGKTPETVAAAHEQARLVFGRSPSGNLEGTFGARADRAADALVQALGGQLKAALKAGGPEAALPVCHTVAIPITTATGEKFAGLAINRVSDKPRNPANAPDATDRRVLARFPGAGLSGEGKLLAHLSSGADGQSPRYYRPLVIGEVCLKCHGDREAMSDTLRQLIAAAYPDDRAHGYALGDLRGLIRVEAVDSPEEVPPVAGDALNPAEQPVP